MLKQTITYEDFDENQVTEDLYFNISRIVVVENAEELTRRWKEIEAMLKGDEKRELNTHEVMMLIGIVKYMMELSYGVKSDDGRVFDQSPELWNRFTHMAAFDAFLFGLFEDTNKATSFIAGIFPKSLRDEAAKVIAERTNYQAVEDKFSNAVSNDPRPNWQKENRKPTPAEIQAMSKDELAYAMQYQKPQA